MRIITNVTPGGMAYTGKLRQKGTFVFFRIQAYVKLGRDFTHELNW